MNKIMDLAIGSGGHVNMWNKGYFEKNAETAGNKFNEDDYVIIGQFRLKKSQYAANKDKFDKYINGLIVK